MTYSHSSLFLTNWETLTMTLRVSDWQSESDLDIIRNSCCMLIIITCGWQWRSIMLSAMVLAPTPYNNHKQQAIYRLEFPCLVLSENSEICNLLAQFMSSEECQSLMNKTQGKLCRSLLSPSNNSTGWYWLILGGSGSVWSGTGWYMMILGQ